MTCHNCRVECRRYGKHRNGWQRYQCATCGKTFTAPHERPFDQMNTKADRGLAALRMLLEGNSVRSTERITDLHRDTILRLVVLVGEECEGVMGRLLVKIPVKDVQCDEIWTFVGKKEAHKLPSEEDDNSIGDVYCFVAIERTTKLVLNFALGRRDQKTTDVFIEGLRAATAPQRFQITTDGFQPYISAITTTLSDRCDFAQLVKVYAADPEADHKYSPPDVRNAEKIPIMGSPDSAKICTSHVERQNLTIRMQMRRLTRLTNAFSKKWDNLWAAYCLHFGWYHFCRIHQTLRITPAMAAGITDHVWNLEELLK
ncbi:MAG: IS1 family transposase [Acidobacteria bacterium]|nr:IS1 family transposase [Acidobacteriota bacterium]